MKLKNLILEQDDNDVEDLFTTQRSPEERSQNRMAARQKYLKQYSKNPTDDLEINDLDNNIKEFPSNITRIGGSLKILNNESITKIPKTLQNIQDELIIEESAIETIESDLTVGGFIYIRPTANVKYIQGTLHVNDSFSATDSDIKQIGSDVTIGTYLDLRGCTDLERIGDNLDIYDDIDLRNCVKLKSIGNNCHIGGLADFRNCYKLESIGENFSAYSADFFSAEIDTLPNNFKIEQTLNIIQTNITEIPKSLTKLNGLFRATSSQLKTINNLKYCGESMLLDDTQIEYLPEGLHVEDVLDVSDTPLKKLPNNLKAKVVGIENTWVEEFPENLDVDVLYIGSTPLYEKYSVEELRRMAGSTKLKFSRS